MDNEKKKTQNMEKGDLKLGILEFWKRIRPYKVKKM